MICLITSQIKHTKDFFDTHACPTLLLQNNDKMRNYKQHLQQKHSIKNMNKNIKQIMQCKENRRMYCDKNTEDFFFVGKPYPFLFLLKPKSNAKGNK